jgi:hypothetical protein
VLKGLKEDIQIKCFFREGNFNRGKMENLLQIYAYHSNKIKYEFIDPDKNPGMVKRYEITEDGTTILESKDKEGRFTAVNEEEITNAVIKISREHIEDLEDRGYSLAKDELEKQGYEIQKLSLALADNFPKDLEKREPKEKQSIEVHRSLLESSKSRNYINSKSWIPVYTGMT